MGKVYNGIGFSGYLPLSHIHALTHVRTHKRTHTHKHTHTHTHMQKTCNHILAHTRRCIHRDVPLGCPLKLSSTDSDFVKCHCAQPQHISPSPSSTLCPHATDIHKHISSPHHPKPNQPEKDREREREERVGETDTERERER